jgi:hypothetical protein
MGESIIEHQTNFNTQTQIRCIISKDLNLNVIYLSLKSIVFLGHCFGSSMGLAKRSPPSVFKNQHKNGKQKPNIDHNPDPQPWKVANFSFREENAPENTTSGWIGWTNFWRKRRGPPASWSIGHKREEMSRGR